MNYIVGVHYVLHARADRVNTISSSSSSSSSSSVHWLHLFAPLMSTGRNPYRNWAQAENTPHGAQCLNHLGGVEQIETEATKGNDQLLRILLSLVRALHRDVVR
eukprot:5340690-Amphidinium_carterae.2